MTSGTSAWKAVAVFVCSCAIAALVPILLLGRPLTPLATEVDEFAVMTARYSGDRHPVSVIWVRTTLGPAALAISGTAIDSQASVYTIEVTGNFVLSSVQGEPRGTNLWIVVQAHDWDTIGSGLDHQHSSLASLGKPETDSLQGVPYISVCRWRRIYHLSLEGYPWCTGQPNGASNLSASEAKRG